MPFLFSWPCIAKMSGQGKLAEPLLNEGTEFLKHDIVALHFCPFEE